MSEHESRKNPEAADESKPADAPRADAAPKASGGKLGGQLVTTFLVMAAVGVAVGAGAGLLGGAFDGVFGSPDLPPLDPETEIVESTPAAAEAAEPERTGWDRFRVAEFALVNQDGEPVTHEIFEDEVTVLSFFFSSCETTCPIINRTVQLVQESAEGTPLRFVSISVDGERDTPERLRSYAEGYSADFDRWTFLTGEEAEVERILRETLDYELTEEEGSSIELPDGTTMANLVHPTSFFLVGPDRRFLSVYGFNNRSELGRLTSDAIDEAVSNAASGPATP